MYSTLADLENYLEQQKSLLSRLKCRLVDERGLVIEDLYDFESVLQSNRKTLEEILVCCENEKILDKDNKLYSKLLENLTIIKSILSSIFDWFLRLDLSYESLADTVIINSSFEFDSDIDYDD